jgi:hypothetical protein
MLRSTLLNLAAALGKQATDRDTNFLAQAIAAYQQVSMRQHTSVYVSIRITSAYVSIRQNVLLAQAIAAYQQVSIRCMLAYVIRQHTLAYARMPCSLKLSPPTSRFTALIKPSYSLTRALLEP